jgi:hypothetical protein
MNAILIMSAEDQGLVFIGRLRLHRTKINLVELWQNLLEISAEQWVARSITPRVRVIAYSKKSIS